MKIKNFIADVKTETRKVDWPTKDKVAKMTAVVLVIVVIMTTFTFFADMLFGLLLFK